MSVFRAGYPVYTPVAADHEDDRDEDHSQVSDEMRIEQPQN